MKGNFDAALAAVLKHEGGWADHPADPGGATMKGVTKRTLEAHLGREVTKDELRAISDETLAAIYRRGYWDAVWADELPAGVDYVVFDCAVNSGPRRAILFAQAVARVTQDGAIGPKTLAAIKAACAEGAEGFIEEYSEARQAFLQALPTFQVFGRGWTRRVDDVEVTAARMSRGEEMA
jgi:lysozyme family protein